MTRNKLRQIERDIAAARRRPNTFRQLEAIAKKLGRRQLTGAAARGKEPTFVSDEFPNARPISIPFHGSNKALAPGTRNNILNDFENDLLLHEEKLNDQERQNGYIQENGGHSN